MATAAPSAERVYLFRLLTLTVDCGTTIIRKIFDHRSSNAPLTVLLTHEKPTITRLKTQKAITNVQFCLLYPPSGQAPTSADFDLTLAICLLRNLRPCGLNRKFNWSSPPLPGDTSLEADICRLRMFRNELAHISTTTGIQKSTFLTKWADIEQVLYRLNNSVPNPVQNLQQTIHDYKNSPLDPETEEKVEKEIERWQEIEKELETKVQHVQENLQTVTGDIVVVKDDVTVMKDDMTDMKEDVKEVKGELEQLKDKSEGKAKKDPSILQRLYRKIHMRKIKKGNVTFEIPVT
ncbi:uncharacterized protein LOC123527452 [Mercenaria mercenaria]|uniref:uncharacterized protein LOC123527452 n=1 Tax=Mercenaria mercenaria TaxID=6596 RepID=UPI00234E60A3|nr:uncharacterized protein LOC123527452 [Mercenaria mercenaria]XP_045162849.2 uncharacterized protein LOC123527452 [Mercenaria mercenaria]